MKLIDKYITCRLAAHVEQCCALLLYYNATIDQLYVVLEYSSKP